MKKAQRHALLLLLATSYASSLFVVVTATGQLDLSVSHEWGTRRDIGASQLDFVSAFGATDVHGDLYGPKPILAPAGAIILHVGDNIAAIVNATPIGSTFYFEPGVYRGVSLAPKDGQTFIGAEGAILNGSEVLTNWTQQGNLWVIGGQTQQGQARPDGENIRI